MRTTTGHDNGKASHEALAAALASLPKPIVALGADHSPIARNKADVTGRTLWLPRMPYGGSYLLAAAFRSIGYDARVTPPEDLRTLELGGKYTSGDECYPQRIVLGDFMKLVEDERLVPAKTAFLLPTANGPCRFGQYASLLERILDDQDHGDIAVFSLTSADGYADIGDQAQELIRTAWRAVVVQDILLKLLLKIRPYEVEPGQTDRVYLESLDFTGSVLARQGIGHKERMADLLAALVRVKESFLAIAVRQEDRPLIGVVGEIFCRLNTFANNELIRHIEAQGGECWLSGVGEWGWYTNEEAFRRYREEKRRFGKDWLKTFITARIMHHDEKALMEDFYDMFASRKEPHVT